MKSKLSTIFFVLAFVSCGKNDDDISGEMEISGKIFIQNPWDSTSKKLVSNIEVFVRKDTSQSATAFLSSTKSDKDGFFSFRYLYADFYYGLHAEIRAKTTLDNDVLFSADTVLNPISKIELVLKPDLKKQNALFIKCIDTLNPFGTFSAANVYIYRNKIAADLDIGFTGNGSYLNFSTKNDGTAFKMNLYYDQELYVKATVTIGTLKLKSSLRQIKLEATGMMSLNLEMRQ